MFRFILISLCLVLVSLEAASQEFVPETASQQQALSLTMEDELVVAVGTGFAKAVRSENSAWYECGKITPKEEYDSRGVRIAFALRKALLEIGLKGDIYLWGAAALVYQESRGNPCAIGPNSRKWAKDKKLVGEKHWIFYTEDDVKKILLSKDFKKRRVGADAGISQTIFPYNASMYDPALRKVRTLTVEEMITLEGGAKATAFHMIERAQDSSKYPWLFWPGHRDDDYAKTLAYHVRRMGGPFNEMFPHCKNSRVQQN